MTKATLLLVIAFLSFSLIGAGREDDKNKKRDCHGWTCFSLEAALTSELDTLMARRDGEDPFGCGLPEFDAQDIPTEVIDDPTWSTRPFILRGDLGVLRLQEPWGRQQLIAVAKKHKLTTRVGHSWDIVMNKGEGTAEMPLKDYVKNRMYEDTLDGDTRLERSYSFDRHSEILSLPGYGFPIHGLVESFNETGFTPQSSKPIVLVGGAESGVGFHRHAAAVHMNIHGWKRWLFYAPEKNPPGGVHGAWGILDWLRNVYPTLSRDAIPIECVQKPGDIVYLPEGWYHAAINLADSVAVSLQQNDLFTKFLQLEFDAKSADNIRGQGKRLRQLLKLQPENLEAQYQLFLATKDIQAPKAIKLITKAIKEDPFFIDAQYALANLLADLSRAGNGDMKFFREALLEWKPYLENNTRSLQANNLLSQYYFLSGRKDKGVEILKRNIYLQKLGIKANGMPNFEEMLASVLRQM